MIGQFPWDPFPPSGEPDPKGPDPVQTIAFRAAVTAADAYRSVRLALRREGGAIRVDGAPVTGPSRRVTSASANRARTFFSISGPEASA